MVELEGGSGSCSLVSSVSMGPQQGRLLVAKELLNRGATVDLRGSSNTTPLMFAVNHPEPLP